MRYAPPPCPTCGAPTLTLEIRKRSDGAIARRLVCPDNHRVTVKQAAPAPKPTDWAAVNSVFALGAP